MSEKSTTLGEKFRYFPETLERRKEEAKPITVDLERPGEKGRVEFFVEKILYQIKSNYDGRFTVLFKYADKPFPVRGSDFVQIAFHLHSNWRQVEMLVTPGMWSYFETYPALQRNNARMIVAYSDKHGKQLTLRPREFDEPGVPEEVVSLVEILFNDAVAKLELAPPGTLFDFAVIREYIEQQAEAYEKHLEIWGELSKQWYVVSEAWDNSLGDG